MKINASVMPFLKQAIETRKMWQSENENRMPAKALKEYTKTKTSQEYREKAIITPFEIRITI